MLQKSINAVNGTRVSRRLRGAVPTLSGLTDDFREPADGQAPPTCSAGSTPRLPHKPLTANDMHSSAALLSTMQCFRRCLLRGGAGPQLSRATSAVCSISIAREDHAMRSEVPVVALHVLTAACDFRQAAGSCPMT